MANEELDHLQEMLELGWTIEGYSNTLLAAGAMTYSVLLRDGNKLVAVTIVRNAGKEVGRTINQLSPAPAPNKGWFG